ncbi:PREDICTED: uncharacterized protein LOC109133268 [Camelina sativa]|uniref:Uncharacterized protein LOC109133268 n=1 Tax=Camelina sativa TaxID=90675 RepID=A0ABM1RS13_CAMSA|nr:PREDICTED: uncharacterized protein LOC109133268 [Camelina sativa]
MEQSFRLRFMSSNHEAEYEALIAGLQHALGVGVKELAAFSDSQLVTSQFHGNYDTNNKRMDVYLWVVRSLTEHFSSFELTKIPRGENSAADALAALASTSDPLVKRVIPVERINKLSIPIPFKAQSIHQVESGIRPNEENLEQGGETESIMKEAHEGPCGNYSGGRSLALRIKWQGYFRPTMLADCDTHAKSCDRCQRQAPMINQLAELMSLVSALYPFMQWSMDAIGPLEQSGRRRVMHLLVVIDYFTKWIEAESYQSITGEHVKDFLWKNVVCRHGETAFSLAYGIEDVVPAEISVGSIRRVISSENETINDGALLDNMTLIDEKREQALKRAQNYQNAIARFYNSKVRPRNFIIGERVLRKVFDHKKEKNAGKMGMKWEDPYKITEVVRNGVYRLVDESNEKAEPRPWNIMNLKKYLQ